MSESPYSRFDAAKLSLNDYLAIDRTVLANQRTLLAYIRTALALLVLGASLLEFFDRSQVLVIAGYCFIGLGAVTVIIGVLSYRRMKCRVMQIGSS